MRLIKFKGWNKKTKKMIDLKAITPLALDASLKGDGLFLPFNEDIVLLQWTGLLDRNQKEIYESDWLQEDDGRMYFIVWAEDEARFELENFDDHTLRHIKDVRVMVIVGNDYEK